MNCYRSILVVSENQSRTSGLLDQLVNEGFVVSIAKNAQEAVVLLASKPVTDVLLIDAGSPEAEGLEWIERALTSSEYLSLLCPTILIVDDASVGLPASEVLLRATSSSRLKETLNRYIGRSSAAAEALDYSYLLELIAAIDDPTNVSISQIEQVFYVENEKTLEFIEHAFEANDWELLAKYAHSIKSSCANFGARRVCLLAGQIERKAQYHRGKMTKNEINALRLEWEAAKMAFYVYFSNLRQTA